MSFVHLIGICRPHVSSLQTDMQGGFGTLLSPKTRPSVNVFDRW